MKLRILTLGCILIAGVGFSQAGKLKKADNYFNHLSYAYAAPLYEQLVGSEVDSPALKSKLAYSYYQLGDHTKSIQNYEQVVNTPEATADDYFYYAQALKQTGNYAESDKWLAQVEAKNASDKRLNSYQENPSYVQQIEKQGVRFSVQHLKVNTQAADFGAYPTTNEQEYYFVTSRKRTAIRRDWSWNEKRFLDLYRAKTEGVELIDAERITKRINSKYHEGPLCFTSDGKRVYFTRNNLDKGKNRRDQKGIQNLKLLTANVTEAGKWENISSTAFNSKEYSVGHPTLSPDGKTLYFASDMPGGFGGADIYRCTVNEDGSLSNAVNMGAEVNTEGQEMFPWMDAEGRLFYASNGLIGLGGLDVFVLLPNASGAFAKPLNVGLPVNGKSDDFAFVMKKDGQTGYFSSNREGGSGDDDIYSFTLLKPFKKQLMLEGIALEKGSNKPLAGATVTIKDNEGKIQTAVADANGKYSFPLEENKTYTLVGQNIDYFDGTATASTQNLDPNLETITKDVVLEKDPGLALYTLVADAKSNLPLEGVQLKIVDNMTGETFIETLTPASGDALKGIVGKKIGDRLSYNISLEKEGYFPKTVTFNTQITQPGVINVDDALKGGLKMDREVKDLTELVQINPINFDLNKYNIRPDAAKELDKIVEVMNKYPNMVVELGSHTDCRASYAYNEKLSDRRAKASAAYIKERITNPERIYGKGYGESRLLNGCECEGAVKSDCSEEEHEKNRRTEFKVISNGGANVTNTSTNSFDNK